MQTFNKCDETCPEGFVIVEDFINDEEANQIIRDLETKNWLDNRQGLLKVQVYGPYHDQYYRIKPDAPITPFPHFCKDLMKKISDIHKREFADIPFDEKLGEDRYSELFVTRYLKGDTLPFHVDHTTTYGDVIYGISLLSNCFLAFRWRDSLQQIQIPQNSLYLMSGPSRFRFSHGISVPCADKRISLTFRTIRYRVDY